MLEGMLEGMLEDRLEGKLEGRLKAPALWWMTPGDWNTSRHSPEHKSKLSSPLSPCRAPTDDHPHTPRLIYQGPDMTSSHRGARASWPPATLIWPHCGLSNLSQMFGFKCDKISQNGSLNLRLTQVCYRYHTDKMRNDVFDFWFQLIRTTL